MVLGRSVSVQYRFPAGRVISRPRCHIGSNTFVIRFLYVQCALSCIEVIPSVNELLRQKEFIGLQVLFAGLDFPPAKVGSGHNAPTSPVLLYYVHLNHYTLGC